MTHRGTHDHPHTCHLDDPGLHCDACVAEAQTPLLPRPATPHPQTEAEIQRAILLRCNRSGVRLFRCNTGQGWTGHVLQRTAGTILLQNPRPLHAGLVTGGSDLIGWTGDGRFCAIEVKTPRGTVKEDQSRFIAAVLAAGGCAGVARSVADAERILGLTGTTPEHTPLAATR